MGDELDKGMDVGKYLVMDEAADAQRSGRTSEQGLRAGLRHGHGKMTAEPLEAGGQSRAGSLPTDPIGVIGDQAGFQRGATTEMSSPVRPRDSSISSHQH